MLSVRLLGPVRIEEHGRRVGTNLGDNTLALLAYLLLNRSAPVARSTVAVALWPDEGESDALVRMRRYLFRLNGALPKSGTPAWIVGDKWSIQWNPAAPLWLDVDEFRRLSGEPKSYARALELYTGDLLSEYDIESLEESRLQLRSLHEQTLLNYVNTLRNQGDLRGALGICDEIASHRPLA